MPCTGCRYCIEEDTCPASINIPAHLDLYNEKLRGQNPPASEIPLGGTPKDCVGCGTCASRCPQSIDIPEIFKRMTA